MLRIHKKLPIDRSKQWYLSQNLLTSFAVLFILLFIGAANWTIITAPLAARWFDALRYFTYGNTVVKDAFLRFGQLGLWDNHSGLGYPLIGHLSSTFYPITLLGYFIPDMFFSIRVVTFLHMLTGGLAAYYLCRTLKANRLFSVLAGCIYMVNYYVMSVNVVGINSEIYNLTWMPLTTAFLWIALFEKKKVYAALAGTAFSMHILSMSLYSTSHTLMISLFLFVFAFVWWIYRREKLMVTIRHFVLCGAIFGIVGFGLSAIKLLPVLEYSSRSIRWNLPLYGRGSPYSISWELQTVETVKDYVLHFITPKELFFNKYELTNVLFFGLVVLGMTRKKKESVFFGIITVFSLVTSLGKNSPIDIYALIYHVIPGLNTQEHVYRMLIISTLSIPVLAALGGTRVANWFAQKSVLSRFIVTSFLAGCCTIILICALFFVRGQMKAFYFKTAADILRDQQEHPDQFQTDLEQIARQSRTPIVVTSQYYIPNFEILSYSAFLHNFQITNPSHPDFGLSYQYFPLDMPIETDAFIARKYKLLQLMHSDYLVTTDRYIDATAERATLIKMRTNGALYKLKNVLPLFSSPKRAFLLIGKDSFHDFHAFEAKMLMLDPHFSLEDEVVFSGTMEHVSNLTQEELQMFSAIFLSDAKLTKSDQELLDSYESHGGKVLTLNWNEVPYDDVRWRSVSVMTDAPARSLNDTSLKEFHELLSSKNKDAQLPTIVLTVNTPEHIEATIDTKNDRTFIRWASTYYPGWKLKVDGKETKVFMADGITTGFVLSGQGHHDIQLTFHPASFYIGAAITIVTTLSLLGFVFIFFFSTKTNRA